MNRIEENLKLLSIFHYVMAGLIGLFSCIPLIHITLGLLFLLMPEKMCENGCEGTTPQFIGWMFLGIGLFVMLIGWTFTVLVALARRFISRHRHHKFCVAVAAAMCLFMPFGTILGVFTLVTLMKGEAEALFER